jgi:hypothetical protein
MLYELTWVQSWLKSGKSVIFQHVKQSSFASIIEAKKEYFGIFVQQTKLRKHIPEPVDNEHDDYG